MRRATDDKIKQRTILKASRASPPRGLSRAPDDVIRQRKIIKAKAPPMTASPSRDAPSTHHNPSSSATSTCPTKDSYSSGFPPPPLYAKPTPSPTHTPHAEREEVFLQMRRVKLFKKVDSDWKLQGTGVLSCCRTASKQIIKIQSENGSVLLCSEVGPLLNPSKLIKESKKGKATYVKAQKGKEVFLLQVKPEQLDSLYSAMSLILK